MKVLAIDVGNTRIKWGACEHNADGARWIAQGATETKNAGALKETLPRCDVVMIANVAGDVVREELMPALAHQPAAQWITSVKTQCGVTNNYEMPAQLGVDRWAAMIGARHLYAGALIVVNAGTALTVDALTADGQFLGGVIVPGFDAMHDILASRAFALKAALTNTHGAFQQFPRNTQDAMTSGAWHALAGTIERVARTLKDETGKMPALVMSGGDAQALIAKLDGFEIKHVDNLVLEGLNVMAREGSEGK